MEISPSSDETFFLNNGMVKFLQIKQDTTRQKYSQKHEKR